jgi:ABC-type transporter Mla subunit MlaD
MSETLAGASRSADILAFPARPARTEQATVGGDADGQIITGRLGGPPKAPDTRTPDSNERLRTALANLDAALAAQRTALADWRGALSDLHGSLGGLGASMQSYNSSLGDLAEGVDRLNQQARSLEVTADTALRLAGLSAPPA